MKVLIPVKSTSKRVPNKNFREFCNGESLFDITLKKVLNCIDAESIYISCDDMSKKELADEYKVNWLLRDQTFTYNETPMSSVIPNIIKDIPGNDDVAWILVTDPLFDEYTNVFNTWKNLEHSCYDSLAVVYPIKHYLLDVDYQPIDFGFGEKHVSSQNLKTNYQLNHTMFICKRNVFFENKYYIGNKPYWYHAKSYPLDIDTEKDFFITKLVYSALKNEKK